ncbi:MAG: hypothetical protein KGL44_04350 [Sphingomonadales bacterium]|nr:hypothetical protein [Sphingomonadales bacterium]
MAKIVQTVVAKLNNNHDHTAALEATRKLKAALAEHGIGVNAHLSIEAGPASGYVTTSFTFPSAVKWAELVDSEKDTLQKMRSIMVEHSGEIISSSLLQEIDL